MTSAGAEVCETPAASLSPAAFRVSVASVPPSRPVTGAGAEHNHVVREIARKMSQKMEGRPTEDWAKWDVLVPLMSESVEEYADEEGMSPTRRSSFRTHFQATVARQAQRYADLGGSDLQRVADSMRALPAVKRLLDQDDRVRAFRQARRRGGALSQGARLMAGFDTIAALADVEEQAEAANDSTVYASSAISADDVVLSNKLTSWVGDSVPTLALIETEEVSDSSRVLWEEAMWEYIAEYGYDPEDWVIVYSKAPAAIRYSVVPPTAKHSIVPPIGGCNPAPVAPESGNVVAIPVAIAWVAGVGIADGVVYGGSRLVGVGKTGSGQNAGIASIAQAALAGAGTAALGRATLNAAGRAIKTVWGFFT